MAAPTLDLSVNTFTEPASTVKHNTIKRAPIAYYCLASLDRDDRRAQLLAFVEVMRLV